MQYRQVNLRGSSWKQGHLHAVCHLGVTHFRDRLPRLGYAVLALRTIQKRRARSVGAHRKGLQEPSPKCYSWGERFEKTRPQLGRPVPGHSMYRCSKTSNGLCPPSTNVLLTLYFGADRPRLLAGRDTFCDGTLPRRYSFERGLFSFGHEIVDGRVQMAMAPDHPTGNVMPRK